jgi:hypothetical protein
MKDMIKVKGIGVAPAEDLLLGHPEVVDVAVLDIADEWAGDKWVEVECVDEIPKSASGKILRVLREMDKKGQQALWLRIRGRGRGYEGPEGGGKESRLSKRRLEYILPCPQPPHTWWMQGQAILVTFAPTLVKLSPHYLRPRSGWTFPFNPCLVSHAVRSEAVLRAGGECLVGEGRQVLVAG